MNSSGFRYKIRKREIFPNGVDSHPVLKGCEWVCRPCFVTWRVLPLARILYSRWVLTGRTLVVYRRIQSKHISRQKTQKTLNQSTRCQKFDLVSNCGSSYANSSPLPTITNRWTVNDSDLIKRIRNLKKNGTNNLTLI